MQAGLTEANDTRDIGDEREQWQGFKQCLELLKGPTDERRYCILHVQHTMPGQPAARVAAVLCRFVGLLLAAKILPAGDLDAIHAVYAAVGPAFFRRLLIPLQSRQVVLAGSIHSRIYE